MSDVISAMAPMSPMPILKMEGGGVMPMSGPVLHGGGAMCGMSVSPSPQLMCSPSPASIITAHPAAAAAQQLQLLHPADPPSPIHAVPSLVNDEIADVENSNQKEMQSNQVR